MSYSNDLETTGPSAALRTARMIGFMLLLVVSAGFFAGFFAGHREDGDAALSWRALAIVTAVALATVALIVQLARDYRSLRGGRPGLPRSERASLRLMAWAMVGGLLGGVATLVAEPLGLVTPDGLLSPVVAVLLAILLATLAPWMTWRWWRAIDEHEQSAYVEGANIAGHFTLLAGMGWWVLDRADLVPGPDVLVLVIAMSFVWTGVWFYRRYF